MLCDYSAGWISGVISLLIGHPFDTIKIQQQVYGLSLRAAVRRINTHRGFKGYYRGLLIPLLTNGTLNAVFFGVYGDICDYLIKIRTYNKGFVQNLESHPEFEPLYNESVYRPPPTNDTNKDYEFSKTKVGATFTEMFIAGSIAGMAQLSLSAPTDLIKTKLQSQLKCKIFKGPIDCFLKVFSQSGVRGIYRGLVPMTFRNLVGSGVNFTVICSVMKLCERDVYPTSWVQTLTATGAAGITSWWFVLPFDVIKSRMQADDHRYPKYRGMTHCAKEIFKTEGIVGLYRGFWLCTARAFPVNATTFLVYEYFHSAICEP